MASFVEAMAELKSEMDKLGISGYDEALLIAIAKSQGPSIYLEDAKRVSCSAPEELARVKNNFLIRKLGLADDSSLDGAIKAVCEQLGSSNRNKFRIIFYYLLTKNLNKESLFA
ncbi:MAG: DUF2853 family protein [Ignavibacteriae bacterium]|nr:DUF2853 family protein [Ignavibacteriota bacterium]